MKSRISKKKKKERKRMKLKRLAINDLAEELSQCQRRLVAQSKGLCNSATLTWEGELDLRVRVQNELT